MKRIIPSILFSLAILTGCRENSVEDTPDIPSPDFNLAVINHVSDPDAKSLRDICIDFSDRSGNSLQMTASCAYRHLEAGRYSVTAKPDSRMEVSVILSLDGKGTEVNGGHILVSKKNHEYLIRFELDTERGKVKCIADGKKLYFDEEEYSSHLKGGDGFFQKDLTVSSKILNTSMHYSIYLPEGYDAGKEYPVLYILHGMGGNNNDWLQDNNSLYQGGGTLPAYAKEFAEQGGTEMIIVSPEGKDLFYCNGYEHGVNYMSYFFEEFIPYIESTYPIKSERGSRAIGGLSMGGYGSLYYGLLHPEMFCHVYACSAAVSVGGNCPDLTVMLGEAAKNGKIKDLPELTIEIGTEDFLFANNEAFIRTLDSYGVTYEYITRPGTHDWKFWNACSPKIIRRSATSFIH